MAITQNFGNTKPSLLLDFANTKQLDSRITFTRASTASFYNGVTTAMAEQNLMTYSQEIDNAAWTKYLMSVTANATTAPDGTTTAELIAETTANNIHLMENYTSIVSGQVYTFAVFLKKGTGATAPDIMQVTYGGQGFGVSVYANFNLNTGTVTATGAGASSSSIVSVGNGWYRCWVSGTATNADWYYHIDVANTSAFGIFTGDGSSGVYAWGPQMEIGSVPTSYIPTSGAAVTRAADVINSPAITRAVDSAVIKPAEFTKLNSPLAGTLYGEGTIISGTAASNGVPALVGLSNSADRDTHRFLLRRTNMAADATNAGFNYRLATVINGTSYSIDYSAAEGAQPEWEDGAVHKTIFGIDATSQQAYGDGVSAGLTSIAIPNFDKFDQVELGNGGSSATWNGHIRKIAYYNKRLSNTQLQALTV